MSIETMKQALDWMEWFAGDDHSIRPKSKALDIAQALRQAIEHAQKQEPVAWWNDTGTHIDLNVSGRGNPLYTSPPQRQPLTDEEIQKCYETTGHYQTLRPQDRFAVFALARAIEAKLKGEA